MKLLIVSLFVFVFLCVQHSADAGVVDRIRLIFSSIKNNIDHRINRQNNYNSDNSNNNSNSSSNSTTTSYKGYSNRNYNSNSNKYYNSNDKNYVIQELQENLNICNDQIRSLKTIIQSTKSYTQSLRKEKDYQKRVYEKTIDELKVAHKNEIILMNNNINTTIANKYKDQMEKDQVIIREQITTELTTKHQQEIQAINKNHTKEIRLLRDELSSAKLSLSQSNATITDLRNKLKIQKSEHDKVVQDYQGKEKVAEKTVADLRKELKALGAARPSEEIKTKPVDTSSSKPAAASSSSSTTSTANKVNMGAARPQRKSPTVTSKSTRGKR